jgi:ABC-2 type transport system ATP-binding protein
MNSIAVNLTNISKTFNLPLEKKETAREYFTNWQTRSKINSLEALKKINLTIKKGEWFGLIGDNGAGKSTLLKLIAQIYQPNHGKILTQGLVVPFLELGVGFNPELSARDNIYLNGVFLGLKRSEIKQKFNTIVKFAGIKPFIGQKLKNFSSGMQVRLAFSIAIQSQGDIFLLDEVMSVGDFQFQKKAKKVFETMKKQAKTVIIVSHQLEDIIELCDKVVWLDQGQIKAIGSAKSVIKSYTT